MISCNRLVTTTYNQEQLLIKNWYSSLAFFKYQTCLLWIIVCLFVLFLSAIVLSLVDLQLITHRNRTLFYRVGYNLVKLTSSGYVRYAYCNICRKTGDVNECLVFEECQTAIPVLNEQLFLIVCCCY
jgi:hypothetical protein